MQLDKEKIETMLLPVEGESSSGVDLREDTSPYSLYYKIKDYRTDARSAERKYEQTQETQTLLQAKQAWKELQQEALDVLISQSKDLEIVAWLIEAMLRNHGLAGLTVGFEIAHKLIETFWPNLYPQSLDDDEEDSRLAALAGLNGIEGQGSLIAPMAGVNIVQSSDGDHFSYWQYKQAFELEAINDSELRQRRLNEGAVTLTQLRATAETSPPEFSRDLFQDIKQCLDSYQNYVGTIQKICQCDHFPSSQIQNALLELMDAARAIYGQEQNEVADHVDEQSNSMTEINHEFNEVSLVGNRNEAFKMIRHVADYFRHNEPQSPLPYILDRAIRWGNLPLHELISEVVSDSNARQQIFELTGMRQHEDS